jgi:Homeodomain-like domain/DDE superfamily endonuclease
MEKYRVTLVPEERAALEQLISAGRSASRKLTHARILLLADGVRGQGHADDEIVTALDTSLKTIARVRKRFVIDGLEAAIDHRPQPACPDKIKIKGNVEQKLVQLACTDPPRGRCHWTLQLLADEMVVLGLVDSISTETVRNWNTHDGASLYETFRPEEARRILDKIEFHYTPKHGSWLNMAETEINIMGGQCLNRRLDNRSLMAEEVAAWEKAQNARKARIHWTFTLAVARQKLRKLYPSIED